MEYLEIYLFLKNKKEILNNQSNSTHKNNSQDSTENINKTNKAISEEGYFSMTNKLRSEIEYQEFDDEKFYLQAT